VREEKVLDKDDIAQQGGGRGRPKSGLQPTARRRKTVFDAFRSFRDEAPPRTAAATPKAHELAIKFRPPVDLLVRGTLEDAKRVAQEEKGVAWLLANVQDIEQFATHVLNRDVWADHRVKELVRSHFALWQTTSDSDEGMRFVRIYRIAQDQLPCVAVLDAISGECLLRCTVPDATEPHAAEVILE
jgi:hypothetical protein